MTLEVSIIPPMTAADAPAGYAISDSGNYASYEGWKAVTRQFPSTWWQDGSGAPFWVQVQLPEAATVTRYLLTGYSSGLGPKTFKLQGSANGSDWTDLDSRVGESITDQNTQHSYTVASPGSYLYYRLYITATNNDGATCIITMLQLFANMSAAADPDYIISTATPPGNYNVANLSIGNVRPVAFGLASVGDLSNLVATDAAYAALENSRNNDNGTVAADIAVGKSVKIRNVTTSGASDKIYSAADEIARDVDPGIANVMSPTAYKIHNVDLVGTATGGGILYDDIYWDENGLDIRLRATPLPVASAAYVRFGIPHLTGFGRDVLPDTDNVKNGIWYGTDALEFEGTYGTATCLSSLNIRDRIRDRSARAILRIAKRLGFQFNFQADGAATAVEGLWAIDVSSDEVRTIFGGNVDALNRVIDIPRQTLITGEPFPPAAGFKVNCRIIINDLAYGCDPNYATVDVQDAAVIRIVLRRWEYITMELDG